MNFVIVYCILSGERSTRYRLEVVTRHHRVLFLLHHLLSSQVCLFQQPCGITFLIASVSLVRADGGGAAAFCMQVRNVYTHLHPLRMKSCTAAGTARLRFSVGREGRREVGDFASHLCCGDLSARCRIFNPSLGRSLMRENTTVCLPIRLAKRW